MCKITYILLFFTERVKKRTYDSEEEDNIPLANMQKNKTKKAKHDVGVFIYNELLVLYIFSICSIVQQMIMIMLIKLDDDNSPPLPIYGVIT